MSPFRAFERKCIDTLKNRMSLPDKSYEVVNQEVRRWCYKLDGTYKYLVFTREQFAGFLLMNHIIYKVGEDGKMFKHGLRTYQNRNNSFLQVSYLEEIKWEDIRFSRSDVLNYCARYEFEGIGGITGHCTAKIIQFTSPMAA